MSQKFHITICAIIVGLFSVLFSPYTAVANTGKEPPCEDIRLLNQASQEWCRHEKGWGRDTKGRWVLLKGKKELKTPAGVVGNANDENQRTPSVDRTTPPQAAVSAARKKELNRLPSEGRTEKVPEQQIYWTEGKRIRQDYKGHLPKGRETPITPRCGFLGVDFPTRC